MIDKFFYKIFGFLDNMLARVDEVFTFNFPFCISFESSSAKTEVADKIKIIKNNVN